MQVFDQQVAPAGVAGQQRPDFFARRGVDTAAFERAAGSAALRGFHRHHSKVRTCQGRLDRGQDSARPALPSRQRPEEPNMTSPVDPNDVMMTGENSFIRFSPDGGKAQTDRVSHWRVLWCPAGAGHALFAKSTLTGGAVRIWSDNPPVARWLQKEIESHLFPAFADAS